MLKRWRVGTNRGDDIRARFVVLACGVLNMPKLPGIPGSTPSRARFSIRRAGNTSYTGGSYESPVLDKLAHKRVAIVGTGATAIQAVPHLAQYAKHLYVVQRTPSSVDERPNPPTDPDWVKSLRPAGRKSGRTTFIARRWNSSNPGEPISICDIWTEISAQSCCGAAGRRVAGR